ncbi:MAG: glycopeptide resistance accessory protein VanW [Roseburia sp.]|nr:glycopeptide resistance accessory protein VanW [Ruminococcus sp.]MCM1155130.1 glycopeptide resistance accessory protein VanW [Roseburia sp.]MCM1242768.1 glycopeptide resistance accessory protein VanW [Roseburia sp.]
MSRKRITQLFPFLIPLRTWQRKKCFYLQMRFDKNRYARTVTDTLLPYTLYETSMALINENSGQDRIYQINKVHNLKLAARTLNRITIAPGEVFSFWQLARRADKKEKYKDGLNFVNGKLIASYGGGLCQLSNLLYILFLHSPLTVIERHGHTTLTFPPADTGPVCGIDATIHEGWLDLKARNETEHTFQIVISFDEKNVYGRILTDDEIMTEYEIYNAAVSYRRQSGKVYQTAEVWRKERDRLDTSSNETLHTSKNEKNILLYVNQCEIAYNLPDSIYIEE